jgi:hypothetical protein
MSNSELKLNKDYIDDEEVIQAAAISCNNPRILLAIAQMEKERKIVSLFAQVSLSAILGWTFSVNNKTPEFLVITAITFLCLLIAHGVYTRSAQAEKALSFTFVALTMAKKLLPQINNENQD